MFAGLLVSRGAVGAFFAAIPAAGQALVADHVAPGERGGAMASLGAANGVGLVVGPALAAALAQYGLGLPLYVTAVLPLLAFAIVWRLLPRNEWISGTASAALGLGDARLRRPMIVAFAAMFSVAIGQITVGFFAIDRLQLEPEPAARAAGLALTGWAFRHARFSVTTYLEEHNAIVRIPVAGRVCAYALDPHEVWKGYDNAKEYAAFTTKTLVNKDGEIKRRIMSMFGKRSETQQLESDSCVAQCHA